MAHRGIFAAVAAVVWAGGVGTASAAPLSWADWSVADPDMGASGTIGGIAVTVSSRLIFSELSGPSNDTWWEFMGNPWAAYAGLPNRPQDRDVLAPGAGLVTVSFARPIRDPVFAILSLGQQADPDLDASWAFDRPFVIGGQGLSVYGEGLLEARPGNILYGAEGSGWIRFSGNVSSISFTVDKDENFSGFTVGGVIPEPQSWAMMLLGFGAIGARLRKLRRPVVA